MKRVYLFLIVGLCFDAPAFADDAKCSGDLSVFECMQKAVEAAYQAKKALEIAVPRGAVIAFNLSECPEGWLPYQPAFGRVIVGSGNGDGLSPRKLGEKGGKENHTLSIAEMPSHSHEGYVGEGPGAGMNETPKIHNTGNVKIGSTGGGQAHNIMQPFTVLTYCERK